MPQSGSASPALQLGFTYLGLLFAVVVMGLTLTLASEVWSTNRQREREQELLFIGHEFREAIGRYYELTPSAAKTFPPALDDLIQDPRFPDIQRHLRRVYVDPMTGSEEWGLVLSEKGGIQGVYSLSNAMPIRTGNFDEMDRDFTGKLTYSDWKFIYDPQKAKEMAAEKSGQPFSSSRPPSSSTTPGTAIPTPSENGEDAQEGNSSDEYGEGYVDEQGLYE